MLLPGGNGDRGDAALAFDYCSLHEQGESPLRNIAPSLNKLLMILQGRYDMTTVHADRSGSCCCPTRPTTQSEQFVLHLSSVESGIVQVTGLQL